MFHSVPEEWLKRLLDYQNSCFWSSNCCGSVEFWKQSGRWECRRSEADKRGRGMLWNTHDLRRGGGDSIRWESAHLRYRLAWRMIRKRRTSLPEQTVTAFVGFGHLRRRVDNTASVSTVCVIWGKRLASHLIFKKRHFDLMWNKTKCFGFFFKLCGQSIGSTSSECSIFSSGSPFSFTLRGINLPWSELLPNKWANSELTCFLAHLIRPPPAK